MEKRRRCAWCGKKRYLRFMYQFKYSKSFICLSNQDGIGACWL